MQLTWDDIVLHTILEFEAQVRHGQGDTWRTVGVMREWAAADAIAMTAARDFEGRPPTARRVVVVDRAPTATLS
jgi:hypothetical protein